MDIKEIERLLITTYRKDLYRPFIQAIAEYELIKPGDRIAVCISGGKDSLTMAKLMQEYQRHGQVPIEVVYIVMDPGFTEENVVALEENAKKMCIPIEIVPSDIFEVVERIAGDYPCYMCARMRRGTLYSIAKQKGCNKIALAHHFDDAIETILLNIFYGGTYKCMMPKLKAQNFPGMDLIRPLIYIKKRHYPFYQANRGYADELRVRGGVRKNLVQTQGSQKPDCQHAQDLSERRHLDLPQRAKR